MRRHFPVSAALIGQRRTATDQPATIVCLEEAGRALVAQGTSALSPGTRSQLATFKLFVGDRVGLVVC